MIGVPVFALTFRQPELWLLALLAVPLILAYLVEPRRRRGVDPFFFLWERLARPKPLLGRLARVTEFLLLLTALLLIVAAVTDPGDALARVKKPMKIVAAVNPGWSDDAPYRSSALAELRALLAAVPPEETGCVVAGSSEGARLVVPPTHGPLGLPVLSGRIPGRGARAPLRAMVDHLERAFPGAETHWFDADPPADLPSRWVVHRLRDEDSTPSLSLSLRSTARRRLAVAVANRGGTAWKGALVLESAAGRRHAAELELEGGARRTIGLEVPADIDGALTVALVAAGGTDPVARAGHFVPRRVPPGIVVIARPEDSTAWRALLATFADHIDSERSNLVPLEEGLGYLEAQRERLRPFDLVVFQEPPARWPDLPVPVLLFGGAGPLGSATGGESRPGAISSWEREHPLLAGVDLSMLVARAVVAVKPAPGVRVLASGAEGPMLLYRAGPTPVAAFPFRFESSNLDSLWGFISLINNLVKVWGRQQPVVGPLLVGEVVPLPAGEGAIRGWRAGEKEPSWEGHAGEGFPFRPRKPGRFRVAGNGAVREAFVNTRPLEPASPGEAPTAASAPAAAAVVASVADWRSWVRALAWAALGLLLIEWLVYHRGWL